MFKSSEDRNDSNFWISYADLMAGLLFVFILLIGAIVSKSTILREHLHKKEEILHKTSLELNKTTSALELEANRVTMQKATINEKNHILSLKEDEIRRLNQLLLLRNSSIDKLNNKVIILQNLLNDTNQTLTENKYKLDDYKNRVLVLSNNLNKKSDELNITQTKLENLLVTLDQKESKYEDLLKELQSKRAKIKYLTGIRLRIIDELKKSLGSSINVAKDGSLKLNSRVLFNKGSSKLKNGAKVELKKLFTKYITALMGNPNIKDNIERIEIEGHTDSDGGYLYNLELSQQRALSVMNYLLTLPVAKKYTLEHYLTATGRSYLDRVVKNNKEDKEASRRIEFKFRLKNQNAFYEIEKILDEDK